MESTNSSQELKGISNRSKEESLWAIQMEYIIKDKAGSRDKIKEVCTSAHTLTFVLEKDIQLGDC
jgi:hypothetical protein